MTEKKKELIRAVKFTLFSVSAGIVQIVSFTLLNEALGLVAWQAHLISLILSVLWNFTLNRQYTFHAANNIPLAMLKVALLYAVFTPLSTWWTAALAKPDGPLNEYLVEGGTMIVNFVVEYVYMRFFVFANSIDAKKK